MRETRYKAVVIPKLDDAYVVVKDRVHQEWTFVVGGCKRSESGKACALRELREETRGVLGDMDVTYAFQFQSRNRSKQELANDMRKGLVVTTVYEVYFATLPMTKNAFNTRRKNFFLATGHDDETDDIRLMTRSQLENANMWRFMKEHVLEKL